MSLIGKETPSISYGSDEPLVKPQTPKQISNTLLEWMDEEAINYHEAADAIGISNSCLVSIINCVRMPPYLLEQVAAIVPGVLLCESSE